MNEVTKKRIIAIGLVVLILLSTVVVYTNLDKLENIFSPSEPVIEQDEFLEEDEVLDPTAEKVMELIQQVDESMIRGYIEKLTSFGPHPTARRLQYKISNRPIIGRFFDLPIEKVANYIYKEFESMGLEVRYHAWEQETTIENLRASYGWYVGRNIEATLPGTNESSDEIYVLVAHHDTMPDTVGANDDSSGVAAVLAAAKLMSQYSFDHTIRFLAADGEEQGLFGAFAYVEEAVKNNDNIVATLCIDMIGNQGPGYRDLEVLVAGKGQSSWIVDLTNNVNQRYAEYLNFTIIQDDPEQHASDHRAFLIGGYDAIFFAEATHDLDRHKPTDTLENMDISYAANVFRLVLATAAELAWDVEYE